MNQSQDLKGQNNMAKEKQITFEELSLSNMWQIEAMYRLMIKKGLITKNEFEKEFRELKKEYDKEKDNGN